MERFKIRDAMGRPVWCERPIPEIEDPEDDFEETDARR